ncbi:MAG TPA: AraC family transcriptional regulator ligand-binding domain-containing protein [Thermoanaerobaculia bacterium]|nr:AraC family transcriptional regulator ligand-binding domain-containing protein [Thermoanaerobaculia bacterium]
MTAGCTPERTAGAGAARALMDYALSRGAPLSVLLERSGIEVVELRDDENRIPLAKYISLMTAAREACNDPAFALHFGESNEGAEKTFACLMGAFSPTMRLALDAGPGADTGRYRLTPHGEDVAVVDTWYYDFPDGAESSYARAVTMSRRVFPGRNLVKAIHFTHAERPYRAEYDRVFGVPLIFGADCNAAILDATWLQQIAQAPSRSMLEVVKTQVDTLIDKTASARSTRERVEALLTNLLHDEDAGIETVARQLGMSRHTLFRKLRAEGVTFRQVQDELRRKLALHYLSDRNLPVTETAYRLGFSDPAAFSRAFKRWTGHSPNRAR